MAIITTDAVLLRKQELRETSLILTFFTRESGLMKGVIKGVRCPQPQFGALYETLSLDRIVFYERRNKELFTISHCELLDYFPDIRNDLEKLGYGFYFSEIIEATCGPCEKNEDIFNLLVSSLRAIGSDAGKKRITKFFEIRLVKALGLMPNIKKCFHCGTEELKGDLKFSVKNGGILCKRCHEFDKYAPSIMRGTVSFMDSVDSMQLSEVQVLNVSREVEKELERLLGFFLNFHIQKRLNSIKFMKQVGVL